MLSYLLQDDAPPKSRAYTVSYLMGVNLMKDTLRKEHVEAYSDRDAKMKLLSKHPFAWVVGVHPKKEEVSPCDGSALSALLASVDAPPTER